MKLILDPEFPDIVEVQRSYWNMGMMFFGMSILVALPLAIPLSAGKLSPTDPGSICIVLLFTSPLLCTMALMTKTWKDNSVGSSWWLHLAPSEAKHWVYSGRLDREVVVLLHLMRTGYIRRRQGLALGNEWNFGKGYRYTLPNGLYILWSCGSQTSYFPKIVFYQFYVMIGGINEGNEATARRLHHWMRGMRLLERARTLERPDRMRLYPVSMPGV